MTAEEEAELAEDISLWFDKLPLKTKVTAGRIILEAHGILPPGTLKRTVVSGQLVESIDGKEVKTRPAPLHILAEWINARALQDAKAGVKSMTYRIEVLD